MAASDVQEPPRRLQAAVKNDAAEDTLNPHPTTPAEGGPPAGDADLKTKPS